MSKRVPRNPNQKIDWIAMDALLHGLLKSLDYVGDQRHVILDRMDAVMLHYLVETKTVPSKPNEFARSLRKLLVKNGYGPRIPLQFKPGSAVPSFPNFVEFLGRRGASRRSKGNEKVDWILYEMVLYGMTKTLDNQLGAQGQLILKRIGAGMLDFLVETGAVERSSDATVLAQNVADFFVKGGYCKSFQYELEGSPPDAFVSRYESARYYSTVFRRLRKEGSALFSCPLCLVGESIWEASGWKFGDVFEARILSGDKILVKTKLYPLAERFTEEDAQKLSQMKA